MTRGKNKAKAEAKAAREGDPTTESPSVVSDGSVPTAGPFDGEGEVDGEELDLEDDDDLDDDEEEETEETDLSKSDEDLTPPPPPAPAAKPSDLAALRERRRVADEAARAAQPELKRCRLVRGTIHDHAGKLINKGEAFYAPAKDVGWMVDTGNVKLIER